MIKLMKNKKGGAILMMVIVIGGLALFMFATGTITSFIIKRTFSNIPGWFWVALVGFTILILLRRKSK